MNNGQRPVPEQVEKTFGAWQKSLVDTKRADNPKPELIAEQQRFVRAATSSDDLVGYLVEKLNITREMIDKAPPLERITEKEMLTSNLEWERHVASQLKHVTARQARSSPWWYISHVAWLNAGTFQNPPNTTFEARLNERILSCDPTTMRSNDIKKLDKATRNLLRRLGGLPHIRRNYRIAEDPPIARAWWRYRIAANAAKSAPASTGLTERDFHRILRVNWGEVHPEQHRIVQFSASTTSVSRCLRRR